MCGSATRGNGGGERWPTRSCADVARRRCSTGEPARLGAACTRHFSNSPTFNWHEYGRLALACIAPGERHQPEVPGLTAESPVADTCTCVARARERILHKILMRVFRDCTPVSVPHASLPCVVAAAGGADVHRWASASISCLPCWAWC